MHRLKGQGQPPAPLATDGRALKELLWCGGEGSAALRPDGSFQQKKLACKLVEGGECEKQLLGRARQCQRALGEKQACRQEVEARARRCKEGELPGRKGQLGSDPWQLEQDEEESSRETLARPRGEELRSRSGTPSPELYTGPAAAR
ncbi:hypothetical protein Y1Q_0005007 [Alligator mississippiensis]|uniref:Uncharacterized protein n=1 Tax=Alligator mississippiensis TaxID=8496 RepID=A0A151PFS1_ALLMI|nr:hypothetical protein Y1Q_0005007 [Alligator mississippiensis]